MSIAAIDGLTTDETKGNFGYIFLKKGGREKGAIALVAAMERPGNANYVLGNDNKLGVTGDDKTEHVENIHLCDKITKANATKPATKDDKTCTYQKESELYYVAIY